MKIKTDDIKEFLLTFSLGSLSMALAYVILWLSAVLG